MRTAVLMTVRAPRERSEIRERRGSAAHTGRLSPPHPPVLPPELEPAESEGCFAVAGATALEPAVTGEPTAARLGLLCLISHPATRIGAYLGQSEGRLILWRGSEGNLCGRRGPDPTLSTGARSRGSAPGGLCGQVGRSSGLLLAWHSTNPIELMAPSPDDRRPEGARVRKAANKSLDRRWELVRGGREAGSPGTCCCRPAAELAQAGVSR
jgi:hypothetical protein